VINTKPTVCVIIPALNEELSIGLVIADIPLGLATKVIVVDNGSTDATARLAQHAGALVVYEPRHGYGAACLAGIAAAGACDIIVFLDGDYSDHPGEMRLLVEPITEGRADFVIGSRMAGGRNVGVIPAQARFGNRLACALMHCIHGFRYSDLGPFRAISARRLRALDMRDTNYGWTIEMQIKAVKRGLRIMEVPVNYRSRIGCSKISGTLWGSVRAGYKILYTIARLSLKS
jgi:glycosyltransferase involved in cell wall biosynthesis